MLKKAGLWKNSLINQEPRSERSSPCRTVFEYRFYEMWFLTVDPFIRVSGFIAKLSQRQNCWRILADFHCQEYIQLFDTNCGLFMRLHFTIGCCNRRWTSRCRHGFQFSGIQVLFADRALTLRSLQQSLFPQVQDLMAQANTNFPKVRRMLLYFLIEFKDLFGQPPRCFTCTSLLPFRLFLKPILKFLERWVCADEVHLGKPFQAMDFGLECQHGVRRLL